MRGTGKTQQIIDESIKQLLDGKTLLIAGAKTLESHWNRDERSRGVDNLFDYGEGYIPKRQEGVPVIDHAWHKGHAQENMVRRLFYTLESEHGLRLKLGFKATKEKFSVSGTLIISLKDLEKIK